MMIAHNGIILNALYAKKQPFYESFHVKDGQPPGLLTVHRLQILTDNAGDNTHGDATFLVQLCYHKADVVLFLPGVRRS